MGRDQRRWLSRIQSAGGRIEVRIRTEPDAYLQVPHGKPIRVPIRMLESLMERDLFEFESEGEAIPPLRLNRTVYQLRDLSDAEDS